MTEDAREWETERGFRAETQGRGGRKETGERKVAEFFTTEERRARRRRRAESSGILKKISRTMCDDPLAAIESRSGFRYGGVSRLGAQNDFAVHDFALSAMIQWAGGSFVGRMPTLLEFLGVQVARREKPKFFPRTAEDCRGYKRPYGRFRAPF
jgi:hypothetical protein